MAESIRDKWAAWLIDRRFAGDAEKRETALEHYRRWRDRVLENADVSAGETLLDVGSGDGLVAFGALDLVGEDGRVIFSDVSRDLLDHSRSLAEEMGVLDRCEFVLAPADDLSALSDASVDAVTTRSVLVYVADKRRAFAEFHRVLRPEGRLSIWEPINRFGYPEPPHLFRGHDVGPVRDLADKVKAVYYRYQDPDTDPMLDFDERDLFSLAEEAGFAEVHLEYEAEATPGEPADWRSFALIPGNPQEPNLEEAMAEALTPEETERFVARLRPSVEGGLGRERRALACLWAVKR